MVLKTETGDAITIAIPRSVTAAVASILIAVSAGLWRVGSGFISTLASIEQRVQYIEDTRVTPENLSDVLDNYASKRELDGVNARLDRIEDKLDRLLERGDGLF